MLGNLVALSRHTITGMMVAAGKQFTDWSADYRLFSQDRFDLDKLFATPRQEVLQSIPKTLPFVAAVDDSLFRKRGRKVHGGGYRRDPLGPPFRVNLVWGQRFLQVSAALFQGNWPGPARMIPIDFKHCPTPAKLRKNATPEQLNEYKRLKKKQNISLIALKRLIALRENLDKESPHNSRQLIVSVDGGYTNGTVLKDLLSQNSVGFCRVSKFADSLKDE